MKDKLVPALVVLVVGAAFAVGLMYGKLSVYEKGGAVAGTGSQAGNQAPEAPQQQAPEQTQLTDEQWNKVITDAAAVKGEESAPVTMVEFTDYQCPFCARYYTDTYGTLMTDYVDTGKVQYMVRDLPLSFHENAKPAALAARCAGDQGKYMEYHDVLFENQDAWINGDPQASFEEYAGEVGLNVSAFTSCYDSSQFEAEVDADLALAAEVGATGTPTFFINGQKIVGAQPTASFQSMLDGMLE